MGFADFYHLHIPYPAWAKDGELADDRDFENWKELQRWADRLAYGDTIEGSTNSAQLLCMSVVGGSIAPGGDYVGFTGLVAQYGFSSVTGAGPTWVHPVTGVYYLSYEHRWATFAGGGRIELRLDGVAVPEGIIADETRGRAGRGSIAYEATAGQLGSILVFSGSDQAEACDALVRVAITDPVGLGGAAPVIPTVYSLGTQDAPDVSAWVNEPAGWVDGDAHWIWHSPLVAGARPDNEPAWFTASLVSSSARDVTVEFTADNLCSVWLNGVLLGSESNYAVRGVATPTLIEGENLFEVYAENTTASAGSHPAGFIMSVRDTTTGEVLLRTTDVVGWDGYTSEPEDWTH